MRVSALYIAHAYIFDLGTVNSLRLKSEMKRLILPYFALGFDQHMISRGRRALSATIGELQSLEHVCEFGRPLCMIFHFYIEDVSPIIPDGMPCTVMRETT